MRLKLLPARWRTTLTATRRQARPDGATSRRNGCGQEDGFTLIELLIVIVIIPLVVGAVTVALITSLKATATNPGNASYNQSTTQRLAESHDAQITSALVVRDIQTATLIETSGGPLCPGSGSQVLGLEWNPGPQAVTVSYVTRPNPRGNPLYSLVRQYCGASQGTTTVSHGLRPMSAVTVNLTCTSVDPTCVSDARGGTVTSTDVALVQVVVSEGSSFQYTVSASPRQFLGSTSALVASTPPLLLGSGGAQCGPGNQGLTVYGDLAVNSSAAGSIKVGNKGLTAQQVYTQPIQGGGSPVSGNYTQQPPGPPPYATGPPLVDPFSALPAPPTSGSNVYVYNTTLTTGNDSSDPTRTKLLSGIYILRQGMSGSFTSETGGVFFYITGGSITLTGNAALNLSAMTSGPYAGVLLYQVPSDTSALTVQGTASLTSLSGVIDVSTATVQLSGNGTLSSLGLIAAKLVCNGNTSGSFGPIPTTTTVASSLNPSTSGAQVTFTATVTSAGGGTPTGTATFTEMPNGSTSPVTLCGNVALTGGVATCTTSSLTTAGSPYKITATYTGPLGYQGSYGTLTQKVLAATSTAVASSPNPSVSGQTVQFTATVSGPSGPTGTVTFTITDTNGTTYSCAGGSNSITLAGGSATCTIAAGQLLSANSPFTVTATYGGDASHASSTGTLMQTVNSGKVHIGALTGAGNLTKNKKNWTATVNVTVNDGLGSPVSGVVVTGAWNPAAPGASGCTTAANGQCSFTTGNISIGVPSETWTVSTLAASGYTYDPTANSQNSVTVPQ